jgi:hypothetical protein
MLTLYVTFDSLVRNHNNLKQIALNRVPTEAPYASVTAFSTNISHDLVN